VVAEPGPAAADALRTARAGLALYGLPVDTLVPNRILPRDSADSWLATLSAQQEKCLSEWYEDWAPQGSIREALHLGRDPRGLEDLALLDTDDGLAVEGVEGVGVLGVLGALAPHLDRGERREDPWRVAEGHGPDSVFVWELPLPGAVKEELALVRRGDELLITVGPFRRIVPLPSALRRCTVAGAGLTDGVLRVRFRPDPDLWPRAR
jgi:arsenite-transporting ATPase